MNERGIFDCYKHYSKSFSSSKDKELLNTFFGLAERAFALCMPDSIEGLDPAFVTQAAWGVCRSLTENLSIEAHAQDVTAPEIETGDQRAAKIARLISAMFKVQSDISTQ